MRHIGIYRGEVLTSTTCAKVWNLLRKGYGRAWAVHFFIGFHYSCEERGEEEEASMEAQDGGGFAEKDWTDSIDLTNMSYECLRERELNLF